MTILKLKLLEHNLDQLVNYLIQKLLFDYEKHSIDMTVLLSKDFYFRNMSTQLNMIILKKEATFIQIDIIGGAGGGGIFNTYLGSERAYISKARKVIVEYTEENNIDLEVM